MRFCQTCVVLIAGHAFLGCNAGEPVAPSPPPSQGRSPVEVTSSNGPATQPVTRPVAAVDADDDRAVLDAVMADLLALDDSPLAAGRMPPAAIRVAPALHEYKMTAAQVAMRHDEKQWAALSPEELGAVAETADALVRRVDLRDPLPAAWPSGSGVTLAPEPAPAAEPRSLRDPLNERPVHVYPPGFTADGRHAVLFMSLPWSIHHADGTYLLAREGERWTVVLRQFVYYP